MKGWHFLQEDRRMQYGDNQLVEAGNTYTFNGSPKLCERGLHASERAIDALFYAPGPIVCRVKLGGIIVTGADKAAATERHVLWMADATDTFRKFARWCALSVIDKWDAPDIVRSYLETGDESIRHAAWAEARTEARAAAWAEARTEARAAASAEASAAARTEAWYAAWATSLAAARAASLAAARAAASAAARTEAWDAAWAEQNNELTALLMSLKPDYVEGEIHAED